MARSCDRTIDVVCVLWGHVWEFDLECRKASYRRFLLQTRVGSVLVQNADLHSSAVWRIRNHVRDLSVPHRRHEL